MSLYIDGNRFTEWEIKVLRRTNFGTKIFRNKVQKRWYLNIPTSKGNRGINSNLIIRISLYFTCKRNDKSNRIFYLQKERNHVQKAYELRKDTARELYSTIREEEKKGKKLASELGKLKTDYVITKIRRFKELQCYWNHLFMF